jgi:hypothetical protein
MQCLVHAWSSIKYDSTSQSQPLMKRDRQSAQSSYTYEATFAAGSIGINLQTTRSGFGTFFFDILTNLTSNRDCAKGTYVDSFHRSTDNSLLPAELSGYIKLGFETLLCLVTCFTKKRFRTEMLCSKLMAMMSHR